MSSDASPSQVLSLARARDARDVTSCRIGRTFPGSQHHRRRSVRPPRDYCRHHNLRLGEVARTVVTNLSSVPDPTGPTAVAIRSAGQPRSRPLLSDDHGALVFKQAYDEDVPESTTSHS